MPQFGIAGAAPVGTGIELAGGENDTVIDNKVINQGLWGILIHDLPDPETPPANNPNPCSGGIQLNSLCYFVGYGNEVTRNTLKHNGFFGNVTNSDLADGHIANDPGNCWHGNHDPRGVTSDPAKIQTTMGTCGVANQGDPTVQAEVLCIGAGDPQSCAALPHFTSLRRQRPSSCPFLMRVQCRTPVLVSRPTPGVSKVHRLTSKVRLGQRL